MAPIATSKIAVWRRSLLSPLVVSVRMYVPGTDWTEVGVVTTTNVFVYDITEAGRPFTNTKGCDVPKFEPAIVSCGTCEDDVTERIYGMLKKSPSKAGAATRVVTRQAATRNLHPLIPNAIIPTSPPWRLGTSVRKGTGRFNKQNGKYLREYDG
jgi:hypothetical protein